jgi:hypothetical protein
MFSFSWLKASFFTGFLVLLVGQSAMAQNPYPLGSFPSGCSNPTPLILFAERVVPNVGADWMTDGSVIKDGDELQVYVITGGDNNERAMHRPNCSRTFSLLHPSIFGASGVYCRGMFFGDPIAHLWNQCSSTTPNQVSTQVTTPSVQAMAQTFVVWIGKVKATYTSCLEAVPFTVKVGAEARSINFWIKNDYVIRGKGRWAKCSAKDLDLSSALKTSPF